MITRPLNRFDRYKLPPTAYKTYQIAAPRQTHYRAASCEEFGCLPYHHGWRVHLQELTPEQRHAVLNSGYRFTTVEQDAEHTFLDFEPGQPCFKASNHVVPIGKPALFLVRLGDHRQYTSTQQLGTPEAFRDDMAEHQAKWAQIAERR